MCFFTLIVSRMYMFNARYHCSIAAKLLSVAWLFIIVFKIRRRDSRAAAGDGSRSQPLVLPRISVLVRATSLQATHSRWQCLLDCKRVLGLINYWLCLCEEFSSWMLPCTKKFHSCCSERCCKAYIASDRCGEVDGGSRWANRATRCQSVTLGSSLFDEMCSNLLHTSYFLSISYIFCFKRYRGVKTGSCEHEQSTDSFESIDFSAH